LKDFPSAIYNIPADTSLAFITDDAVAYRKVVPENASPYARVDSVGGMSYKTKNLLPFPYNVIGGVGASKVNAGITCSVEEDRAVMFNGTCTSTAIHFDIAKITLKSGTYNLSIGNYKGSPSTIQFALYNTANSQALASEVYFGSATNRTFTVVNEGEIVIRVHIYKVTLNNVRFYLMLNEGETALPYEPFFDGIRSAKVTELVSHGKNLFNKDAENYPYSTAGGIIRENASYRAWFIDVRGLDNIRVSINNPDTKGDLQVAIVSDTKLGTIAREAGRGVYNNYPYTTSLKSSGYDANYVCLTIWYTWLDELLPYVQVEAGSETTKLVPFVGTIATKPIPEALRNFLEDKGYGLGVNETYHNYIDYERKVFVQKCKEIVFDGSSDETWSIAGTGEQIRAFTVIPTAHEGICDRFPLGNAQNIGQFDLQADYIRFNAYGLATTVDEWRNWLSEKPLTVIYALAEPVEIDISAYLTGDIIEVQGGGTITAVNEYEYAVPSTIQFIKKVGA
jgi:hypothetical protein